MCMSTIATGVLGSKLMGGGGSQVPAPPPPPQDSKTPDMMRKRKTGALPSTMLTGPSGVASGALVTGGNTMLGG